MHTQQANVLSAVNGDERESAPVDRSSNATLPIGAHVHNSRMPLNHLPRIEQDLGLKGQRGAGCRRGCMGGRRCWCRCRGGSSGGCWRACGRWRGGLSDCGGRRRHHGDATGQLRQKQRHRCNRSQRPGAATFALSIDVHHPVARLTPTTGTRILPTACRRTVQRLAIPDARLRPMRPCCCLGAVLFSCARRTPPLLDGPDHLGFPLGRVRNLLRIGPVHLPWRARRLEALRPHPALQSTVCPSYRVVGPDVPGSRHASPWQFAGEYAPLSLDGLEHRATEQIVLVAWSSNHSERASWPSSSFSWF